MLMDDHIICTRCRDTYLPGLCQAVWLDSDGNLNNACTFGNQG